MLEARTPNRRIQLTIVLFLVAASGSWWWLATRPTFERVANGAHRAIKEGDGDYFASTMAEDERRAYGLEGDKWSNVLKRYVSPALRGWTTTGEPRFEMGPEKSTGAFVHRYSHPDGRVATLRIEVAHTSHGIRTVGLPSSLILFCGSLKYGQSDGPAKLRLMKAALLRLQKDSNELRGLGLAGEYDIITGQIRTWEELQPLFERGVANYVAKLKAGAKAPKE